MGPDLSNLPSYHWVSLRIEESCAPDSLLTHYFIWPLKVIVSRIMRMTDRHLSNFNCHNPVGGMRLTGSVIPGQFLGYSEYILLDQVHSEPSVPCEIIGFQSFSPTINLFFKCGNIQKYYWQHWNFMFQKLSPVSFCSSMSKGNCSSQIWEWGEEQRWGLPLPHFLGLLGLISFFALNLSVPPYNAWSMGSKLYHHNQT